MSSTTLQIPASSARTSVSYLAQRGPTTLTRYSGSGHRAQLHALRRRVRDPCWFGSCCEARATWRTCRALRPVGLVMNLLSYSGDYDIVLGDFGLMLAGYARQAGR
jgi:hypothetical protein